MPTLRPRVAVPCSADWGAMPGTDRVRRCPLCRRAVYDLSAHAPAEAAALLAGTTERRCVRFAHGPDGALVSRASYALVPAGRWARVLRPVLGTAAAIASGLALLASTFGGGRGPAVVDVTMGELVPLGVHEPPAAMGSQADAPLAPLPPVAPELEGFQPVR